MIKVKHPVRNIELYLEFKQCLKLNTFLEYGPRVFNRINLINVSIC